MKFSVSSRQSKEYLDKADEMFVNWQDHELIYDLYHLAQNTIILRIPATAVLNTEDWDKIQEYHTSLNGNLKLALDYIHFCYTAQKRNIPFYLVTPINDFPRLNWCKKIGVCEIIPGCALIHQLDAVKEKGIPIRVNVNRRSMPCFDITKEELDDTVGSWIRPEDLWDVYADYIDFVEFDTAVMEPTRDNLIREQALLRIYADQKTWSGDMNMLFKDLNTKAVNRLIVNDFGERRINCRQMCEVNGNCHFCYNALTLANPTLLKQVHLPGDSETSQSTT